MTAELVPALDALGLPGPHWLFHVLLVLTFFVHLVFMNLTLGGTLLGWISHLRAGGRSDSHHGVLAARMLEINTYAISLTITTGVAPLLFIQLLYQRLFYGATVLLGWIWLALVGLLIVGYYAIYAYKFKGMPARGSGGGLWLGLAALMFVLIAMIHVGAHLIHVQPQLWPEFAASPWTVLADPTYWPRLLHFTLAGIAFSGLVTAWWAARAAASGTMVDLNVAIARYAWRWALWCTALVIVDGFVLLMLLPREVMLGLMRGGPATMIPLTGSILLGIGVLMMLVRPIDPVRTRGLITGALASMLLTMATMSITRHQVRIGYIESVTDLAPAAVAPQWGNFVLFAVALVAGLGTVAYLIRLAAGAPRRSKVHAPGAPEAPDASGGASASEA